MKDSGRDATTEPLDLRGLRSVLSEQIEGIRAGTTSPAGANAVTNAVGTYLRSVKLEMEYYRAIGRTPKIALLEAEAGKASEPE